ncbi:DUF2171 domain-containing protein [Sphingomonas sp. CFBP 8760]|uniref:DUF2171 domain-containing protein n=1 Tax=Sphingomonas sp. CFBP 8760 TaxID=2775282 RepID=UPI00178030D4|nr:DUF2171 domain-containing protein [Sphingomonas sp. CFBP 8760]MBD8546229.1 DUF2171 domain-containing protein [Sphingomonas sp. CFBP 8760]
MVYERYPRSTGSQGDQGGDAGYGQDYGSGRDYTYSSARDYAAAGRLNDGRYGRQDQGRPNYGGQRYDQRGEQRGAAFDRDREDYRGGYGRPERSSDWGHSDYGRDDGGQRFQDRGDDRYSRGQRDEYRGSYASDGRRFENVGRDRYADDDQRRDRDGGRGYGRQPQGYDYEERGFFQRAGDEVRSWFGDDDAERRREADSRYDDRAYRNGGQHDDHYGNWRSSQIAAFDRDYDEYRNENRSRFETEFSNWRTNRQTQRDSLNKVKEHQEVVGSDGTHVGTVDKVRGDRILLTKNDTDAGGRHHSIPSSWLVSVDDKVTLSKTADEAKSAWRDEERNQAMFGYGDNERGNRDTQNRGDATGRTDANSAASSASSTGTASGGAASVTTGDDKNLNRSFSGTY